MTEYLKAVEVAEELKIKPSTLRKYSILLEQYNYTFPRDYANRRIYGTEHVEMIKNLQQTKRNRSLTLVEAAEILTEDYQTEEQPSVVISLEEWETLQHEHEIMGRCILVLSDMVDKLGEEVYRGSKEEWKAFRDDVYVKYFGVTEDSL